MSSKAPKCTPNELRFAKALASGLKPQEAYSKIFKVPCNPYTPESQKAKDLARSVRVKEETDKQKTILQAQAQAQNITLTSQVENWDSIYKFAFDRLVSIRDDTAVAARTRFQSIQALEKLNDPAQDINLIFKYVDLVWGGLTAHCPCCHESFALSKIKNKRLTEWRKENEIELFPPVLEEPIERKLYLLKQGEKRRVPHPAQMIALKAEERHVIARGSARAGKSFLMGMFAYLIGLLPGVEIWILARVYDDAQSEVEYLTQFLTTAFYPLHKNVFDIEMDKKTGECAIKTKWGTVIKVKSAKSKGSISGRELEAALVAEPGWVDGDLFEEVRARMSSRLGRIITMGTPKGFGGFLGRLIQMTSRDMRTGKKLPPQSRLIANGCKWPQSILEYAIDPRDNPEYVKSEIETARSELTKAEFESEFEGKMTNDASLKFPQITDKCLRTIRREEYQEMVFVQGIDQGERNFGGCTLGWDGHTIYVIDEYFDNEENVTIKSNLIKLNGSIPSYIRLKGGNSDRWKLTIFDVDPPIGGQLEDMSRENRPWKTEFTFRPKNDKEFLNWREETCMWANEMAKDGRLIFSAEDCDLLHEQLKEALIRVPSAESDGSNLTKKGWIVKNKWRGDHTMDSWLLAMWTIYNNQLDIEMSKPETHDVLELAKKAFDYKRIMEEKKELNGGISPTEANEIYENFFGTTPNFGNSCYHYGDEG